MLEKNKDYVEFTLQCTTVERSRDRNYREVCFNGYSDSDFPGVPMDVVCKEFDHKVVMISKRDFDRLQADNEHYREMAKQWEENYNLLLKKTGFDTVESLVFYLTNVGCGTLLETLASYVSERDKADENYNLLLKKTGFDTVEKLVNYLNSEAECDTLREAIATLEYNVKFARDERRDLSKKLEECEKDYISARDKAEALVYELDVYSRALKEWKEGTGCSSPSAAKSLLDHYCEENKKLQRKIDDLRNEVKWIGDELASANSSNNSWKAAAECNSPKELIEKREALEKENEQLKDKRTHIVYLNDPLGVIAKWEKVTGYDRPEDFLKWKANIEGIVEAWKDETGCKYPGEARILLEKWKEMTKCETPEAAATWITSYESACGRGNRLAESVEKLKEEVVSWKNVTGYSTPEDYMHARISGAFHTPFDYTSAWQKATGFVTPEQAKSRIEELERIVRLTNKNMLSTLDSEIDEWQKFTGCNSPQEAGVKINNLCDDICKWKGNYDHILKLTGYENEKDIRVLLTFNNNKYICKTMREYINYLTRNAKFTESNWQNATGCNTPGEAETTMRNLKGRIDEIKEFAAIASNWTDRIVED